MNQEQAFSVDVWEQRLKEEHLTLEQLEAGLKAAISRIVILETTVEYQRELLRIGAESCEAVAGILRGNVTRSAK